MRLEAPDGMFIVGCPVREKQTRPDFFIMRRGPGPTAGPFPVMGPYKTYEAAQGALTRERQSTATWESRATRRVALAVACASLALFVAGAAVARAFDAGRPGTPMAEISGSGVLMGWTVTLGGVALCDELDVHRGDRTIACEIEEN